MGVILNVAAFQAERRIWRGTNSWYWGANRNGTSPTGHAEAVEVEFDPAKLTYSQLLKVFFENHDPTQVNRQGPDWGSQYRTAIFFHSPEQQSQAEQFKQELEKAHRFSKPIATKIAPAVTFYPAEDCSQI